jgi:hypothetical protein
VPPLVVQDTAEWEIGNVFKALKVFVRWMLRCDNDELLRSQENQNVNETISLRDIRDVSQIHRDP